MVSELCLGCMTFGRELDEEQLAQLDMASAIETVYPYSMIQDKQRV